jgi:hypothetical protein
LVAGLDPQHPLTKATPAVVINGPAIHAGAGKPDWINFTMKSDYYKIVGQMHVLIPGETPGP